MSSAKPVTEKQKNARKQKRQDLAVEVGEGAVGAIAGAAAGSIAGPPGAVVGAILGAATGVVAGVAEMHEEHRRDDRDRELDEEIGVTSGTIGAPLLAHPPTKSQAYAEKIRKAESTKPSQR